MIHQQNFSVAVWCFVGVSDLLIQHNFVRLLRNDFANVMC